MGASLGLKPDLDSNAREHTGRKKALEMDAWSWVPSEACGLMHQVHASMGSDDPRRHPMV